MPQVAIFLLLGAVLGPAGLSLVNLTLESPTLQWIATLGLVLVLFTDAIAMDLSEIRRPAAGAALLVLGPATLLPAHPHRAGRLALLGLDPLPSAILGAALASTDPVMLRSLFRRSSPARGRAAGAPARGGDQRRGAAADRRAEHPGAERAAEHWR